MKNPIHVIESFICKPVSKENRSYFGDESIIVYALLKDTVVAPRENGRKTVETPNACIEISRFKNNKEAETFCNTMNNMLVFCNAIDTVQFYIDKLSNGECTLNDKEYNDIDILRVKDFVSL